MELTEASISYNAFPIGNKHHNKALGNLQILQETEYHHAMHSNTAPLGDFHIDFMVLLWG